MSRSEPQCRTTLANLAESAYGRNRLDHAFISLRRGVDAGRRTVERRESPTEVNEPGANVTFTVTVDNLSSVDTVTIHSLTDTVYGDLNGQADCSVPQVLPPLGSYSCSFTGSVTGEGDTSHTNVNCGSADSQHAHG